VVGPQDFKFQALEHSARGVNRMAAKKPAKKSTKAKTGAKKTAKKKK
jgi:hypothetical protein